MLLPLSSMSCGCSKRHKSNLHHSIRWDLGQTKNVQAQIKQDFPKGGFWYVCRCLFFLIPLVLFSYLKQHDIQLSPADERTRGFTGRNSITPLQPGYSIPYHPGKLAKLKASSFYKKTLRRHIVHLYLWANKHSVTGLACYIKYCLHPSQTCSLLEVLIQIHCWK